MWCVYYRCTGRRQVWGSNTVYPVCILLYTPLYILIASACKIKKSSSSMGGDVPAYTVPWDVTIEERFYPLIYILKLGS